MSKRSDALYTQDIKEAIEAIFAYTRGITFDDFKLDRMRYSPVIRPTREYALISYRYESAQYSQGGSDRSCGRPRFGSRC